MKRLLVLGAGKSTGVLIQYLLDQAQAHDWHVRVADRDADVAAARVGGHPRGEAFGYEADDVTRRIELIAEADLVVSMLPASLHPPVAEACVTHRKHFVSASYVAPELHALNASAVRDDVTLLGEMGVDPGIDHASAMERLDALRAEGAEIESFETFTGGLIAPESDDNPWHYKFTWNPRNVVLAGQGVVKFKHNGRLKLIPYHRLFGRSERLSIRGYGEFEGYPNRDSLKYRSHYGLHDVATIYRGTLRRPGFCRAWDCLVQLGLTDDTYVLEDLAGATYRDFVNAYLKYHETQSVEAKLQEYLGVAPDSETFSMLEWLGLFEREPIGLTRATPAEVLQKLLEQKWALRDGDKDMIAMLHRMEWRIGDERFRAQTSMVTLGEDTTRTAMAKTVGLTAGIGAKLILDGTIQRRGVLIPTEREVYEPLLAELRDFGISFDEEIERIPPA